jgi:hypothetical protein
MRLSIEARLDYTFNAPTDVLLQLEAAAIPEQLIEAAHIDVSDCLHFARVPAGHDRRPDLGAGARAHGGRLSRHGHGQPQGR